MSSHTDPAGIAVGPTSACRIPIFLPTRRPSHRHVWRTQTSWGWCVITGKLGQQHRDLLDAARVVAAREDWTTDGRMHLLVDPAKLRSVMGGDSVNWPLLKSWFTDLMQSIVEYHVNSPEIDGMGSLISDVAVAMVQEPPRTRPGAFSVGRRYLRVSFGLGWSRLLADDRAMRYPLLSVISLRHGFSQAVARFCLSHRVVNDSVSGLMLKVGAEGRVRKRRSELAEDDAGLRALGILVDGDWVKKVMPATKVPVPATKVPVPATKVPVKPPVSQYDHQDQARLKTAALSWNHTPLPAVAGRKGKCACGAQTTNPTNPTKDKERR